MTIHSDNSRPNDVQLSLYDPQRQPLTVRAVTIAIASNNKDITESRLCFRVNPKLYQRIEADALFNLKSSFRGDFATEEFFPEQDFEITACLNPELQANFTSYLRKFSDRDLLETLQQLSQEQPENPFFFTENWFGLQIKQSGSLGKKEYRTFWDYYSPSFFLSESVDSEAFLRAIDNFSKDWAFSEFKLTGTQAIAQALEAAINENQINSGEIVADAQTISQAIEEVGKAFQKLANFTQEQAEPLSKSDESLFETMVHFFTSQNWSFLKIQSESALRIVVRGTNNEWYCYAKVREQQQQIIFYSVCPFLVPNQKRTTLAEFLIRVNCGLVIGNFDMDFDAGEIYYKTSIDISGTTLTSALIRNVISKNLLAFERYLPGIEKILSGEVLLIEAIEECEKIQTTSPPLETDSEQKLESQSNSHVEEPVETKFETLDFIQNYSNISRQIKSLTSRLLYFRRSSESSVYSHPSASQVETELRQLAAQVERRLQVLMKDKLASEERSQLPAEIESLVMKLKAHEQLIKHIEDNPD